MLPPQKEAPRARNAAATRQAILDTARHLFARDSYDTVGVRDIAGAAGVDAALVSRYFGSKEALFKCVLSDGKANLFDGVTADRLPAHFTRLLLDEPDGAQRDIKIQKLLIILRSATSPTACELVREAMQQDMLRPAASILSGEDGEFRASLAMALLMGTGVIRSIMAVSPLCDCKESVVEDRLERLFAEALAEE